MKGKKVKSNKNKKKDQTLKVIPLGGLDGIGKNMTLLEYGDNILIIDCGIMFPSAEMPGVDLLVPDFTYLIKNKTKIKGIVITHGHEDHIGAVAFLLQEIHVPVYATKLTLGLIKSRLEERPPKTKAKLIEVSPRQNINVGIFGVEFIRVNHSIVDCVALAIKTPLGTIIHTGDFKIDFTPVDGRVTDMFRFSELGEKGVLLLLSDSTNAERQGYTGSEIALNEKLFDAFSSARGRIIVASFASNINRIQQVLDAAQRYNRKVVVSGRSMLNNIEISENLGYLKYNKNLIVDLKEAGTLPDKKLVIICTGTQGEPMSALTRIANGTHKNFVINRGDRVVITASVIPGNERTVSNVINALLKQAAEVYYEQSEKIHVSGHGSQEELKLMLTMTKPRFFIPVHGEYKHLKAHAALAEGVKIKSSNIIVAENGNVIEVSQNDIAVIDNLNLKTVFVDGQVQGDLSSDLIKDRQQISTEGIIYISIVTGNGMLMLEPDILARGFAVSQNQHVLELIRQEVNIKLDKLLKDGASKRELSLHIKKSIKKLIFRNARRNPVIVVNVLEV